MIFGRSKSLSPDSEIIPKKWAIKIIRPQIERSKSFALRSDDHRLKPGDQNHLHLKVYDFGPLILQWHLRCAVFVLCLWMRGFESYLRTFCVFENCAVLNIFRSFTHCLCMREFDILIPRVKRIKLRCPLIKSDWTRLRGPGM
jgi:hypothetical protein